MTIELIDRPKQAGMSDDQLANEKDAQWKLNNAMGTMRDAIRAVNAFSAVVKIRMDAWEEFIHDELPGAKEWAEKIAEARDA